MLPTGVPKPHIVPIGGENSSFDPSTWMIKIGPALMKPRPSIGELAMLCDHVRHEIEHAVIDFRRIRREARLRGLDPVELADQLKVPVEVAEWAARDITAADPAGSFYESVAPGTVADAQAKALSESLANPKRKEILDRIIESDTALDKARADDEAAGTKESADALAKAEAENQQAFRDYAALPDEKLAWNAGEEMQVAVRRIATLHERIRQAVARLERHELARNHAREGDPKIGALDRDVETARDALRDAIAELDRLVGR
jgi:hypothetical protein